MPRKEECPAVLEDFGPGLSPNYACRAVTIGKRGRCQNERCKMVQALW